MTRFDFGINWKSFSQSKLNEDRVQAAMESLQFLFKKKTFEGLTFLDIGCGSGLFSIAAYKLGAKKVLGMDVNPVCISVSKKNAGFFKCKESVGFRQMSVLDAVQMSQLEAYDLVYAWGSLHHTGSMWKAITNSAEKVKEGGLFTLAIYKKHWTSPLWKWIKWVYNHIPKFLQIASLYLFGFLIFIAKFIITGKNPLKKERGMDFWHDVIDWMGGYPYEYATEKEIKDFVFPLGFQLENILLCETPTGCNEFVFKKMTLRP